MPRKPIPPPESATGTPTPLELALRRHYGIPTPRPEPKADAWSGWAFELTGPGGVPGAPGAVEAWVTEDLGAGIIVRYRLAPRRGSLVVVGLEVTAETDAPGVTARVLRGASPARAVHFGMRMLGHLDAGMRTIGRSESQILGVVAPGVGWSDSALWRRIATPDRVRHLTREERLALVARVYVDSLRDGERKVNAAIAAFFGIPVSQSRERVREARREGFLTYSPGVEGKRRGRIEGELTPKAAELLAAIRRTWRADPRPVVTVPRGGERGLFDVSRPPKQANAASSRRTRPG
jgi:hypothetical protein